MRKVAKDKRVSESKCRKLCPKHRRRVCSVCPPCKSCDPKAKVSLRQAGKAKAQHEQRRAIREALSGGLAKQLFEAGRDLGEAGGKASRTVTDIMQAGGVPYVPRGGESILQLLRPTPYPQMGVSGFSDADILDREPELNPQRFSRPVSF